MAKPALDAIIQQFLDGAVARNAEAARLGFRHFHIQSPVITWIQTFNGAPAHVSARNRAVNRKIQAALARAIAASRYAA